MRTAKHKMDQTYRDLRWAIFMIFRQGKREFKNPYSGMGC